MLQLYKLKTSMFNKSVKNQAKNVRKYKIKIAKQIRIAAKLANMRNQIYKTVSAELIGTATIKMLNKEQLTP